MPPEGWVTGGRTGVSETALSTNLRTLLFLAANTLNGIPTGGGGGGSQKTPLFETYSDWDREVKRTGASGWRVSSVNEGYMVSTWCVPLRAESQALRSRSPQAEAHGAASMDVL